MTPSLAESFLQKFIENGKVHVAIAAVSEVVAALESDPIEIVGKTKDGRPNHKWTKHERVNAALTRLREVIEGQRG